MEIFEVVNESGDVIGTAPRNACHGNPSLVHRAAHVLVLSNDGRLLLQLRSKDKDVQPGRWDTSVGGHLGVGESFEAAAVREANEELGLSGVSLTRLYDYPLRNETESENIRSFITFSDGPFACQVEEIDEVRFWTMEEIYASLGKGVFTPNFEQEFRMFEGWRDKKGERHICRRA